MPLARIVTSTPEQVSAAVDHLRARGFTVEVISPGQPSSGPADIEIEGEGRTPQDVLSLAVEASQTKPRRVIAYDMTGRPVEFASDEEEEPQPPRKSIAATISGVLHQLGDDARMAFGNLRDWVREGRETIAQRRAGHSNLGTPLSPEPQSAQAEATDIEEQRARLAAERAERERAQTEARARQESLERQRREELEREREEERRAAEERRRAEERARELALAEERRRDDEARRQQALAEERRREEERAAEQSRIARQRQLEEEQRQAAERERLARIAAERERFAREQQEAARTVNTAEAVVQRRPQPPPAKPAGRDGDLKKAMVVAAALALLATLGYAAYANRHAPAPLSNRDLVRSQAISQPVPFGAATATPAQSAPNTHPQAALPQNAVEPPAGARQPAPKPRLKRQSRRYRDDDIADDEVVIHHSSAPTATSSPQSSGLKRYSDLQQ